MRRVKLTREELGILSDDSDVAILETIKGMTLYEMRLFDFYSPTDLKHFNRIQRDWISTEKYLLSCRNSSEADNYSLITDFNLNHIGERFHVFYTLKYPDKVEPINSSRISREELIMKLNNSDIFYETLDILKGLL